MENKLFDVKRGGLKTNKGDEGGWTVDGTEGASSTRPDKHMGDKDEQDHHDFSPRKQIQVICLNMLLTTSPNALENMGLWFCE